MTSDCSRGLTLTMQAIHRQLAAMPYDLYRLRLIHNQTRRPLPGQRLWTRDELLRPANVRFLRIRNREGFDVFIHLDNFDQNAGYILLDLDYAVPGVLHRMQDHGRLWTAARCLRSQKTAGQRNGSQDRDLAPLSARTGWSAGNDRAGGPARKGHQAVACR
jgi:hypothetical protein